MKLDPIRKAKPVGGKAAWHGPDIARSDDWVYHITPGERAELLDALAHFLKSRVDDLHATQADFPLPNFGPKLQKLEREADGGRGILLMRGLPLGELSEPHIHRLYWGISLYLGVVMPQSGKAELIGDIRNRGLPGEQRGYTGGHAQKFHTDACDIVLLMCRMRAKEGGVSRLASTVAIHDYMVETRPDLAEALYTPTATAWVTPDPVSGQTWFTVPFFGFRQEGDKEHFACRFSYNRTLKANTFPDTPKLTAKQIEAIEYAFETGNRPQFYLDMTFEPGDLQFVVNHQIIHGRTEIFDWPELERKRHVIRMWLATPTGRPLPYSWEDAYTSVEPASVRGGVPWWWFTEQFGDYRARTAKALGMKS